jgi:hypothetical protein
MLTASRSLLAIDGIAKTLIAINKRTHHFNKIAVLGEKNRMTLAL